MSDNWSELSPHESLGESGDSSLASTNGKAPPDAAIAVADAPLASAVDTEPSTDIEAAADAEDAVTEPTRLTAVATAEAVDADVEAIGDAPASIATAGDAADAAPDAGVDAADDGESFLADLARAMQETAAAERQRVAEDIARRRQELIDRVREREAAEATKMRELADEDSKVIDAWAEEENRKIQAERDRRAAALQEDLATSLEEHHAQIEAELAGLETSIASYREEIDRYFDVLQQESDPLTIAEHARQRPAFPSLDQPIVAEPVATPLVDTVADEPAPADEPADTAAVGVMDAEVATTPGIAPWELAPAAPVDPDVKPILVARADSSAETEAVPAQASAFAPAPRSSNALLRAIPALRPTSAWLGRDGQDGSEGGS